MMPKNQPIKPIGSFFEMTKEGYIINPTSTAFIPIKWLPLVNEVVEMIKEKYGNDLHSIYLRGSVARGAAVDGFSDLDIFVLLHQPNVRWEAASWLSKYSEIWSNSFGFVKKVEVMCSTFSENMYTSNPALAMIIKTQSLLLFGSAISEKIPSFKPSKEMMLNYRWLAEDLATFFAKAKPQTEDVQEITKVMIRCGFEIVMQRSGKYTVDLFPSYQVFAEYYPKRSSEMKSILFYYLNPAQDLEALTSILRDLGDWMVLEIKKWI